MTIWVSRVELSEARRHLLNIDDRTYSSGDWLARFVPTANICTAANDVHGAMIPIAIGRLWRQSSLHERRAGVPSLRPVATSIDVRRDRQKGPKQWLAVRLHALPFARPIQTQASR